MYTQAPLSCRPDNETSKSLFYSFSARVVIQLFLWFRYPASLLTGYWVWLVSTGSPITRPECSCKNLSFSLFRLVSSYALQWVLPNVGAMYFTMRSHSVTWVIRMKAIRIIRQIPVRFSCTLLHGNCWCSRLQLLGLAQMNCQQTLMGNFRNLIN